LRLFKKPDPLQRDKWENLHKHGYHPSVQEAKRLVEIYPEGQGWIFEDWSRRLKMDIPVKDKTVLEIGFGGGWYLAQLLQHGAAKVIGFEASQVAIEKTRELLEDLNLHSYELHRVTESYLGVLPADSVDVIFQVTVFQHITEEATRNYLRSGIAALKEDGLFINQFLLNDHMVMKDPYAKGKKEGIVYYSEKEVLEMIDQCGYDVITHADHTWTDENKSYWRYYVTKPRKAGSAEGRGHQQ
jgi:cyclopropane fatty-acyl-phospholipid synthase-like methyltransferase